MLRKIFDSPELQKLTAAAYPPPAKVKAASGAKGGDAAKAAAGADSDEVTPSRLDIRWVPNLSRQSCRNNRF